MVDERRFFFLSIVFKGAGLTRHGVLARHSEQENILFETIAVIAL